MHTTARLGQFIFMIKVRLVRNVKQTSVCRLLQQYFSPHRAFMLNRVSSNALLQEKQLMICFSITDNVSLSSRRYAPSLVSARDVCLPLIIFQELLMFVCLEMFWTKKSAELVQFMWIPKLILGASQNV